MSLPFVIPAQNGVALSGGAGGGAEFTPAALVERLAELENMLLALDPVLPVGVVGDNSPAWLLADLALLSAGRCAVPIPAFFSPDQVRHLVSETGIQFVFFNGCLVPVAQVFPYLPSAPVAAVPPLLPLGTQKITFTSGTTGNPKGVCLTTEQQMATVNGLAKVLGELGVTRHLSLLPLAVLLENIAGIYVPLSLGAQCIVPPLAEVGLSGSSSFDVERCLDAISRYQAESIILLPQMLQAIVWQAKPADSRLASLKFVAVGGGTTPLAVLKRAEQIGLPVFEGYGLSECASVVSLNSPSAKRLGSVGKPLPGVAVRLAADGEIEVKGRGYAGLLGEPALPTQSWISTGDLGAIDQDGFLRIAGRKKNVLITSFGRNVSPEWPEGLLMESGLLAQVVVMGDGEAALSAVLVPNSPKLEAQQLAAAVAEVNAHLPDYAQIARWVISREPFSPANGLATVNGRPRREAITQRFSESCQPAA
jgi:long-subunit acyl-CoA synthetase (AMP-forming)